MAAPTEFLTRVTPGRFDKGDHDCELYPYVPYEVANSTAYVLLTVYPQPAPIDHHLIINLHDGHSENGSKFDLKWELSRNASGYGYKIDDPSFWRLRDQNSNWRWLHILNPGETVAIEHFFICFVHS